MELLLAETLRVAHEAGALRRQTSSWLLSPHLGSGQSLGPLVFERFRSQATNAAN
jgi:hypothetical protein